MIGRRRRGIVYNNATYIPMLAIESFAVWTKAMEDVGGVDMLLWIPACLSPMKDENKRCRTNRNVDQLWRRHNARYGKWLIWQRTQDDLTGKLCKHGDALFNIIGSRSCTFCCCTLIGVCNMVIAWFSNFELSAPSTCLRKVSALETVEQVAGAGGSPTTKGQFRLHPRDVCQTHVQHRRGDFPNSTPTTTQPSPTIVQLNVQFHYDNSPNCPPVNPQNSDRTGGHILDSKEFSEDLKSSLLLGTSCRPS